MRKSHVLALFGLLAGAAIGVVWFTLSASTAEVVEAPEVLTPDFTASPTARMQTPVDRISSPDSGAQTAPVENRRSVEHKGALAQLPEDQLRWIEGRLVLPAGAVWDETAVALSVATPERRQASRALFRMITREDRVPTAETEVLYRTAINSDGSFRVACAKDAEWAYLEIDARFLYLSEPQAVKLEGDVTHVDLAPLLGSSLEGSWVVNDDASAVESEFTGGLVYLTAITDTNMPKIFDLNADEEVPSFHRTWVNADGTFELRGVDPNVDWTLVSHPPRLASAVSDELELVPGEVTELEVPLVRGSHLAGTVESESGKPLLGARVFVTNSDEEVSFDRMKLVGRESLSRGDGSFDLFGVAPGEVRVHAELDGYRKPIRKKFTLEPGAEELGIVFKMRRGNALRGSVVWPDGAQAGAAVLEVGRDATGQTSGLDANWRTRYGTTEADAGGQFEVVGLKRRAASIWAWSTRQSAGRWVEGVARLDAVEPSEDEELRLVLEEKPLLTGFVRNAEGEPVQDFQLQIRADDGAGSMMTVWMRQDQESELRFQSADGSFRIVRLDEGDYTVTAIAEGYASSRPLGFRLPIEWGTPPLEIELFGFAGVAGVVLGPNGRAVPGAEVSLQMKSSETLDMLLAEVQAPVKTRTNGRGEFSLTQLQPGAISLTASDPEWIDSEPVEFELVPGEFRSNVTVPLRKGATLTVQVLDPEGEPATGYNVTVSGQRARGNRFGGRSWTSSEVDSNGWATFERQMPGKVTVAARPTEDEENPFAALGYVDEDSIAIEAGIGSSRGSIRTEAELFEAETTHLVLGGRANDLGEPVAVRGRVTARGNPIAAVVSFTPRRQSVASKQLSAMTDAEGNYTLPLAFSGDYTVRVEPARGDSSATEGLSTLNLFRRVPEVPTAEFDFAIPAGRISGIVLDPEGEPVKEVPVTLRRIGIPSAQGTNPRNWFPGRNQTSENGEYSFEGLEPGTYVVGAGSSMMALFLGGATGYGRTLSDPVQLAPDEDRRRVDIALGESCSVKGDVVDRDGEPVNGASIFAFDATGVPVDALSTTTSNASGRFIYEGLSPGVYTFMARTNDLASPLSKTVRVDESEGQRLELEIGKGTILVVQLVDQAGVPMPAKVAVTDDRGRSLNDLNSLGGALTTMNTGQTDDLSTRVGPVAPGGYRITVQGEGHEEQTKDVIVRGDGELKVPFRLDE